jgi:hypothetical protein
LPSLVPHRVQADLPDHDAGGDVLAVANDNSYPFDTGRHVGVRTPADNELILVKLAAPLNRAATASRWLPERR